ncbi:prepilin-type N-terminal cleavage/methylation domain-containing protein [Vibrio rumoiensis]|uniref:MSHA biogenesis protein MshA n=1 Tax=Vibrio rumoiensis 1S-45 TaxID=1188252 RepID=A0A1E5E3D8_9VIBR|nr:prepilin-type N-terminal cleavage/methylation domain-containing protein [Vibrio rumoiensis]OEF26816.1 hypothetical protein A1QC_15205 [Vibrio rumoiensis 1S-45]
MRKSTLNKGFTLIELVVVIVILGILAVTAAPKFLNIQDDARASTLAGLKGGIQSAGEITYGKAAVAGVENELIGHIDDGDESIRLTYGYPDAGNDSLGLVVDGMQGLDMAGDDNGQFKYLTMNSGALPPTDANPLYYVYSYSGNPTTNTTSTTPGDIECTLTYIMPATPGEVPRFVLNTDGC